MTTSPITGNTESVDVIVLNWHDDRRTRECLGSLERHKMIDRVYLVDNESDGPLDIDLAAYAFDLIPVYLPENRGFAGGINAGLARRRKDSRQNFLLILNNDAIVCQDSIRIMLDALLRDPIKGLVGPVILNPDGSVQAHGSRISRLSGIARPNRSSRERIDYLTWACVLLHPRVLHTVGGLCEEYFMYWEDADYSASARAKGFEPTVVDNASVIHELSSSEDRAGVALKEYYAWGLRTFGIRHGGVTGVMTRLAYSLLLLARVRRHDWEGLDALRRGWSRGQHERAYLSLNSDPS